jgi:uncharacterized protein (TIGR02246 family)
MTATEKVLAAYRSLLDAWNRQDAAAFAALFTESGRSVGFDGSQMNGRFEIAAALREIIGDHQTARYVAKVQEVRRVGADVTLIRAVAGMVPPGKTEINPATNAIQSVVLVEESGDARIALFQNTPAAFHGRPQLAEALTKELTEVLRRGELVAHTG